jgi:hypothetical protein
LRNRKKKTFMPREPKMKIHKTAGDFPLTGRQDEAATSNPTLPS